MNTVGSGAMWDAPTLTLYVSGCIPDRDGLVTDRRLGPGPVWTINAPPEVGDTHFQLHGLRHMRDQHGEKFFEWLSALEVPVYLFADQIRLWPERMAEFGLEDLPLPANARRFPAAELVETYGPYFTGSFPWLICFALHRRHVLGIRAIALVGVNFSDERLWRSRRDAARLLRGLVLPAGVKASDCPVIQTDWRRDDLARVLRDLEGVGSGDESWAIPCIENRLGIAAAEGVKVYVPEGSGLFANKWGEGTLYGLTGGGHE